MPPSRRSPAMRSACSRCRAPPPRPGTLLFTTAPTSSSTAAPTARTPRADPPKPLSIYGSSKLLGEWFALEAPTSYVLRVESLFGGHPAKSSIDSILARHRERSAGARVRRPDGDAQLRRRRHRRDAGAARRASPPFGLYHCVNSGVTTWHGVAVEAAAPRSRKRPRSCRSSSDCGEAARQAAPLLRAVESRSWRAPASRMPTWQDALARYVTLSRD